MGSLKTLGPDGYQPVFFKRNWELTGTTLHNFAQGVLRGEVIPSEETEALLVLIPKEEKPSSIKGFKSISLCNVCVKVVTKMIVNWLKEVLDDIISPYQTSFIPGRHSADNIVICQEVVHTLGTQGLRGEEWF